MLLFKKITIQSHYEVNGERESLSADIYLTDKGEFLCELPQRLLPYISNHAFIGRNVPFLNEQNQWCLKGPQYKGIVNFLQRVLDRITCPTAGSVRVIAFQIFTSGEFSYNIAGETAPLQTKEFKYRATDRSRIGFSLAVKVLKRKIGRLNKKICQEFEEIGPQDLHSEDPAARINAWNTTPDLNQCQIIAYSEEAAQYFLSLLEGTAQTILRLTDDTHEEVLESDSVSWDHRYFADQNPDQA